MGIREGIDVLEQVYAACPLELNDGRCKQAIVDREMWDEHFRVGMAEGPIEYRSRTPWLALNSANFRVYRDAPGPDAQRRLLERVFIGNTLSFFKSLDLHIERRLRVQVLAFQEQRVRHKQTELLGFRARVAVNAELAPWLGLGKLVSKGFGLFKRTARDRCSS